MRWYFKLIEKTPAFYRYAYSRESKILDGVIVHFLSSKSTGIEKPCANDEGKTQSYSREVAIQKFDRFVVEENFPEERSVCCG